MIESRQLGALPSATNASPTKLARAIVFATERCPLDRSYRDDRSSGPDARRHADLNVRLTSG
jgi:hypothetical protein